MKYKLLLIYLLVFSAISFGQKADSLWNVFNDTSQADTSRLMSIDRIAFSLLRTNPDSAIKISQIELQFAIKTKQKKYQGWAFNSLGASYFNQNKYSSALDNYLKSLKICEELNDKKGIGYSLNNIGLLYNDQSKFKTGLEYFLRALKIREEIGDKGGIASCYRNMGSSYSSLYDYPKALEYYNLALKISEEIGDGAAIASCYNNIGNVFLKQNKYENAIDYFLKPLQKNESHTNKRTKVSCYINLGSCYNQLGNYNKALYYSEMALSLAKEMGSIDKMRYAYKDLAEIYAKTNNYKKAYNNYVLFKQFTDSIFNLESSKQFSDLKTNFEVEKREAELKLKTDAEKEKLKAISFEEKKQQQILIFAITGVLLVVILFSFFLYKRFKITNQQKKVIELKSNETEEQKNLVEEKQREIIDSITYAKRLQKAILPPLQLIQELLPDSFVLYQPKDIVAGDFYWMHHSDDTIFIAAADCTGHGVPGAMVSVVCSNALNRAVNEFGIKDTGKILDQATSLVLETFAKSGEEIKDGMDISIVAIHKNSTRINWSGANNPLWYTNNNEIHIVKADKQPIGKSENPKPFKTHTINLQKGDNLYLITDGFSDQFGGPKGKKYMHRQLQEVLLNCISFPLSNQKEKLQESFDKWKGNLEQVDDVCIIGLRL